MATPAIALRDVNRTFVVRAKVDRSRLRKRRTVHAVRDFDLTVGLGEAVGLVGANGAGKSTTIKMLTGILTPTSGQVRTLGREPVSQRRELARHIGVVFGQRSGLWWDLPLRDSFALLASMHRLTDAERDVRLARLIDGLDLSGFLDRPVRQLSLGQRMRGEVASALLHSPPLVIFDEPTIGLDMVSKEGLRRFLLADRAERGTTLFLTTHDMADVERLCERIVVVNDGSVAYDGTLAGLRAALNAPRELTVDLAEPVARLALPMSAATVEVNGGGRRHRIQFHSTQVSAVALLTQIGQQVQVEEFSMREPAVEDLVRAVYEQR